METAQRLSSEDTRTILGNKLFHLGVVLVGALGLVALALFIDFDNRLSLWAILPLMLLPWLFWAFGVTFMYVRYDDGDTSLWKFIL